MRSQDPEAINPRPNPRTVHIASYLHYDLGVGLQGLGPKKKKQRKAPAASAVGSAAAMSGSHLSRLCNNFVTRLGLGSEL